MDEINNFRILIVDDNLEIHHDFIKILQINTSSKIDELTSQLFDEEIKTTNLPVFEIDVASQGQEGVKKVKEALEGGKPFALAFVDVRMPPGWDGIETIKHIWAIDEEVQIVICTAYSDYSWEETIEHLGKTDNLLILKKPFDYISVRQLAYSLTRKWQLAKIYRQYVSTLKEQVADRTLSLQQSLSLVKSTFESSSDGILVVDNDGHIVDYNQKLVNVLQIPISIFDTKKVDDFLNYLKNQMETPDEFLSKLKNLHEHPDEISLDVINLKDRRILECYSQPHKLNEQIVGRILNFRDVTELQKTERLKNDFIAVVSHELRTPLTSIHGSLKLLDSGTVGKFPERAEKLIEIANRNCQRLLLLINDILDIEKITSGQVNLKLKTIDLKKIVTKAVEMNKMYASKFDVSMQIIADASTIPVSIDPDRLMQVLANLISNACKFSPKGEQITITIKQIKDIARVSISDKGPGISAEFQKIIFQKFSQADSLGTANKGGTGLGLHISKTLIEKMGGTLNFTSKANEGTTFYFELPVIKCLSKDQLIAY